MRKNISIFALCNVFAFLLDALATTPRTLTVSYSLASLAQLFCVNANFFKESFCATTFGPPDTHLSSDTNIFLVTFFIFIFAE